MRGGEGEIAPTQGAEVLAGIGMRAAVVQVGGKLPKASPHHLGALGRRYLAFAAAHPLEYRLMFGTPWPAGSEHAGLAAEARHALDVLRAVLRRIHGDARSQKVRVDLDAMFIWSQMHGLASIAHADVMAHLDLMPQAGRNMVPHAMEMMGRALDGDAPAPSD
jgi:hypothetical protein